MSHFGAAHRWGAKALLPKICQTYPTIMKLGTLVPHLKKIQKKSVNHMTQPFSSADISIFYHKSQTFATLRNADRLYFNA